MLRNSISLLRRIGIAFSSWARGMFLLSAGDHASRFWWRVHVAATLIMLGFVAAGLVVPRLPLEGISGYFIRRGGLLLLAVGLSLHIALRVIPLLYGRPARREVLAESFLCRSPLLTAVLALFLHLGTALSPYALEVVRGEWASMGLRTAVLVGLVVCGTPFWIIVLHPIRFMRSSRAVRGERSPLRVWIARFVANRARAFQEVAAGLRETVEGARAWRAMRRGGLHDG